MLLEKVCNLALRAEGETQGTPAPWDDFWYNPLGYASSSGMRVSPETAKRIAAVLACVSVIGRVMGAMPRGIYSEDPSGGKKLERNHPVYDLLATRPNQNQTAFEYFQMMQGHVELRGNAYSEIIPGPRGAVDQLVPMHPDRVIPEMMPSGRIRYRYNDPLTNQTRTLVQEEVFHLRNFSDDGISGQSTVTLGADVFGSAMAAQDFSARYFRNDARSGMVITGANFKSKEDEDEFAESIRQQRTGDKRHGTLVLPSGLDVKSIGVNNADAQLLDSRKFSRIEICSIFGVPPHLIGETEKAATYASVEQFNIMFAVFCIWPRVVMWEQAIQRDLILYNKYFPKFSMGALLRGDTASRYNAYKVAIENGWMSQDDVRLLEDLNPIPGGQGKFYWRPLNWARLGENTTKAPNPDDTQTSDPAAGDGAEAAAVQRLKLLAASAAERCVRKEVAAIRKLVDRKASAAEFDQFYAEHAAFIVEVLRIRESSARCFCDTHCTLIAHSVEWEPGSIAGVIAAFEESSEELAALAVEEK